MKKLITWFLLLWLVIGLLVGCQQASEGEGGPGTTTEEEAEQGEETGETTSEEETGEVAEEGSGEMTCEGLGSGQTIEMWSPLTGPDGDEMTALAQRYSSENPHGITVNHVPQPEYIQKLNAAAAANQLPAMTVVRVINVGELAERNVLQPFSEELQAIMGEDLASAFPENVWTAGEYEGERYSIPLDVHPLVMYYNKELFAQAGVAEPGTEPMTREEFEQALAQLQSEEVNAIAIGTAFQGATLFQTLIQQFGGSLTNEDGTEVTYGSEAAAEALNYIKNIREQYSADISGANDPEVATFKQGSAAIVIHGPWHISDLQRLDFVGFAPVPQVGDQYAVWGGSHQLALTTDDPAQQVAATCWIAWLSENSLEWAKAGQVPARNEVRENAELQNVAAPIAAVASIAPDVVILPQVAGIEAALWDQFGPAVDAVLMGEASDAQQALQDAASRSQQVVDENKQRYGG